jgi:cold shock CspA family protein/ribosome-associated translation inhibitor RaiA
MSDPRQAPIMPSKSWSNEMAIPVEIVFRNMDRARRVEERVEHEVEKLGRYHDRVMSVHVVVEAPHAKQHSGNVYHVAIHVTVPPGETISVTHAGRLTHAHEDVLVAVRDAFRAARRQLQDHGRRHDGRVKRHEPPLHGKVVRLGEGGYGFIATSDGREVYFHRNSVVGNGFEQLQEGSEVRLVVAEKESAEGPQASSVVPIGKHHIAE